MRKGRDLKNEYHYEVTVQNWYPQVHFNEYAYMNLFKREQYEERFYLVMNGVLSSTTSKKLKNRKEAAVIIHPGDFWYKPLGGLLGGDEVVDDGNIGDVEVSRDFHSESGFEEVLLFRVSVPTKSYEAMLSYLSFKGTGTVSLVGGEMFRRKATIRYFNFSK